MEGVKVGGQDDLRFIQLWIWVRCWLLVEIIVGIVSWDIFMWFFCVD